MAQSKTPTLPFLGVWGSPFCGTPFGVLGWGSPNGGLGVPRFWKYPSGPIPIFGRLDTADYSDAMDFSEARVDPGFSLPVWRSPCLTKDKVRSVDSTIPFYPRLVEFPGGDPLFACLRTIVPCDLLIFNPHVRSVCVFAILRLCLLVCVCVCAFVCLFA